MKTADIQQLKKLFSHSPLGEVLPYLPVNVRNLISSLPDLTKQKIEEIRLRQERPVVISLNDRDLFLGRSGSLTSSAGEGYTVTSDDMERLINLISGSSIYALEEELKSGFITVPGGHRVGITGKTVLEGGKVKTLKYLSGCNIRISREIRGAASAVVPHVINIKCNCIYHTFLISPPRCGKTTILRDLVRQVSNGITELVFPGMTVGLVDERSEIAGCYRGIPQRDIGLKTDVLDGCPKAEGMMMLLRSMGPQVIAVDEIGRREDVEALEEVLNAGVKILATAHGSSVEELAERPVLSGMISSKMIERYIIIGRSRGVGTIEDVIDGKKMCSLGVRKC